VAIFFPWPVHAQEDTYSVNYIFNFYARSDSTQLDVDLDILLTNIRSDVYITEYTLSFPQNFLFKNLRVTNEDGTVPYVISEDHQHKKLTFKFNEPKEGSYSQNHLKLHYALEGMHTKDGRINEMVLPLLLLADGSKVSATLHLPDDFDRTISLSKPVPTSIGFKQIHWEDVKARTILALFGESQVYDVQLGYSLKNNGIGTSTQTIALPPETLFQKVYVKSLKPEPHRAYTDEDGNFLAEYILGPRENVDISFKGFVEVYVKPQSTLRDHTRTRFKDQQNYLLSEEPQWRLGKKLSSIPMDTLQTPQDIYNYVLNKLTYDKSRLQENPVRFGAEKALLEADRAVCMEYTDLFIALAREKGIPAREIQGYGYAQNQRIRPQSLILDELHAWPEFYDRQQEIWMQIDPTWEDTSGIDYLSAFDVNHIALAIHGKDPEQPLPAGMYKTALRKDVQISISKTKPSPAVRVDISSDIPNQLDKGKRYDSHVLITNIGNSFIHSISIIPEAQNMTFHSGPLNITYLAPFETRSVPISYTPKDAYSPSDTISFTYDGAILGSHDIRISESKKPNMYTMLAGAVIGVLLFSTYLFRKARTT
jgi:hypothetical protein